MRLCSSILNGWKPGEGRCEFRLCGKNIAHEGSGAECHKAGRGLQKYPILLVAGLALFQSAFTEAEAAPVERSPSVQDERGQFGFDLVGLRKFYTPPLGPGESNHYFDLWEGRNTREIAVVHGLTNNNALIINSHGKGLSSWGDRHYAYYPHASLLGPRARGPYFSAADLARVLGPVSADKIHNIVISGCNSENSFDANQLRKYFPNATNITHTAPGQLGYQPMFLQALTCPTEAIQILYETSRTNRRGEAEYLIGKKPSLGATKFSPYIAELYRPGDRNPFRTQIAGRELLDPPNEAPACAASKSL